MIDVDGYRPNVGIVLLNGDGRLFWARRINRDGWQFPQGGMRSDETPLEAMYRELEEETGLSPEHVEVVASTRGWLRYKLPQRYVRHHQRPTCIGQKQVWFLLRLVSAEDALRLDDGETEPLNLVLEVKGLKDEADKAKAQTTRDLWVPGVNAFGGFGRWAFAEFRDWAVMDEDFATLVEKLLTKETA